MPTTETATKIELELPQPNALVAEMAPIVALARSFEVTDIDSDRIAQGYEQRIRRAERSWTDYCEPARKAADEIKKKVLALRDGILGPWAQARGIFSAKSIAWQAEQRRKAEEEQRRLQEKTRKEEEDRQLAAAQEAQDRGDVAEAEAIVSETISAPVITVAPQIAKVEGVSNRTTWSAEVTDLLELVKYVAAHPQWITLLEPCMPNLNRMAVAQQKNFGMPGVRAVSKTARVTR